MPLTEVQRAKLTVEIDRLEREADFTEKKALADDESFYSAALTYGSELAGSSGTEHLYRKAKLLREEMEFLKGVRTGATPLADRDSYKRRLGEVESRIKELTEEKKNLEFRLRQFENLHNLLCL